MNNLSLTVQFFLQIAVILVACRAVGFVAARLGQPQVVAEMVTGVMLGPSLLGMLAPQWQQALFPWDSSQNSRDTQSYLYPVSQLGLALYMFVVGLEFRSDIVRTNPKSTLAVSVAGIAAPFLLGAGLAWIMLGHTQLFPKSTRLMEATLFLGAAMSVTALPVLARIIQHKGLTDTLLGTVALGAGAINDVAAWGLLAIVLASLDHNLSHALLYIGCGVGFVLTAFFVIRPILRRCEPYLVSANRELNELGLVVGIALMALGAWFSDLIHLHAVFGAFVMGSITPRGIMSRDLIARIQPLTVALLLPLFFTYSGLNTNIGELNSSAVWGWSGLVLVAAIVGKGIACWLAAKLAGLENRDALGIGILMNARGLMELVMINIGFQRGVISHELFAILVIMAVVTTFMTSPVFDVLVGKNQHFKLPK